MQKAARVENHAPYCALYERAYNLVPGCNPRYFTPVYRDHFNTAILLCVIIYFRSAVFLIHASRRYAAGPDILSNAL